MTSGLDAEVAGIVQADRVPPRTAKPQRCETSFVSEHLLDDMAHLAQPIAGEAVRERTGGAW